MIYLSSGYGGFILVDNYKDSLICKDVYKVTVETGKNAILVLN